MKLFKNKSSSFALIKNIFSINAVLLFLFFFIIPTHICATNYYVDQTGGIDGNSGTATDQAWKTINKVNTSSFVAGDNIYFKRGETWREQLNVPSSGSDGNPITFGAYGTGNKPIINGSDLKSSWSAVTSSIANVQATTRVNSASASVTKSYVNTPTQGNLMIAVGTGTTVIGNASIIGWTLAVSALKGTTATIGIWYKIAGAAESKDVTVAWTGSTSTSIAISEWSGIDATPLDKTAFSDNTGAVTSKTSGTTASTTVANELIYAAIGVGADVTAVNSWSNGFTTDFTDTTNFFGATKIVAATAAYETTAAWTTSRVAGGVIATFKGAAAVANVWKVSATPTSGIAPRGVWFDNVLGNKKTSIAELTSARDWFWQTNVLYMYAPSDPSGLYTTIEMPSRTNALLPQDRSYITFSNLDATKSNSSNIILNHSPHLTIDSCSSSYAYYAGIGAYNPSGNSQYTTIKNSDIHHNGASGIGLSDTSISGTIDHILIQNNTVYNNCTNQDDTDSEFYTTGGIKIYSTPVGNQGTGNDAIIERNTVYSNTTGTHDRGVGIWADWWGNNAIIRYNNVYSNGNIGIFIEKTDAAKVYYNITRDHTLTHKSGISLSGGNSGTASNNEFYNNVSYGNYYGVEIWEQTTPPVPNMSNNIFKNNIVLGNTVALYATGGGQNDGTKGSGNVYTYNAWGPEAANFINYGGSKSTYAAWESAYGATTHSVQTDPLFVSTVTPDFHLQSSSPAINTGTDVSLTVDYASTAVPQSAIPDLGAYEFVPTPTNTPTPTPTQNTSSSSSSSSSNSSSNAATPPSSTTAPGCSNSITKAIPDIFEIQTNNTNATVYFAPPNGTYSSFYISYSTKPNTTEYGVEFNQKQSSGALSYTIRYLQPNTTYYFKIRAGNGCATGAWGNSIAASTTGNAKQIKKQYKNTITAFIQQTKKILNTILPKINGQPTDTTPILNVPPQPTSIPQTIEPQSTPPLPTKSKFCILWWCI